MWSLVTYRNGADGADRLGILTDDGIVVAPPLLRRYAGLRPALDEWAALNSSLAVLEPTEGDSVPDATVLAPVRFPNKLLCAGANYYDHVREMGGANVPEGARPWFFTVPTTTTVIGPDQPVRIPADPAAKVDWEAELAVVIGRTLKGSCTVEEAMAAVAGYTLLNDISARGMSRPDPPLSEPMRFDWLSHKAQDTFKPMGPGLVPAWLVDPSALRVRCWVGGELMQDGPTADMIFDVPALLRWLSEIITLEPGDVVATGTPAGVGMSRGRFLRDGETVVADIEGLGRLANPIQART